MKKRLPEIMKHWNEGDRAFYWNKNANHPLCLQSKEYNRDRKGITLVYYSRTDAKKLYNFLKSIFV